MPNSDEVLNELTVPQLINQLRRRCTTVLVLCVLDDKPRISLAGDSFTAAGLLRSATLINDRKMVENFADQKPKLRIARPEDLS